MKSDVAEGHYPRSRYLVMPIVAFRDGEEFDPARLPVHVETRPWKRAAWLFFCIGGFFLFGLMMVYVESLFAPTDDDLRHLDVFLAILSGTLMVAGISAWNRIDSVELGSDSIRIQRRGLLGTDTRVAKICYYRGIRAEHKYVEDYEVTSGTTYWDVELVHDDPALTVSLFAKSVDRPSDYGFKPATVDHTDWTSDMNEHAKRWSHFFGLPLLLDKAGHCHQDRL
ncbi:MULTISPECIES: hypothetical protein [Pseudomonadota]|uniref:hypothetical protein n=3 Tax=Pseudomonadota TaxID=1224 RepID=UPI003265E658